MSAIVVVEDQPDSLKLLVTLLSLRGHAVIALASGEGLLAAVRDHPGGPDLILLDIQLPGRDGFALLEELRALPGPRRWKVVALTAHAMPADRERAMAAGFDGYITKPIDIRTFPREVAAYLDSGAGGSVGTAGAPESGSH